MALPNTKQEHSTKQHEGKYAELMVMCAVPHSPSAKDVVDSTDGKKSSNPLTPPINPEDEDHEEQKRRDASWKAMKYSLIAFGATFGIIGSYMVYELGTPGFCLVNMQNAVWVSYLATFQGSFLSYSAYTWVSLLSFTFIRLACTDC